MYLVGFPVWAYWLLVISMAVLVCLPGLPFLLRGQLDHAFRQSFLTLVILVIIGLIDYVLLYFCFPYISKNPGLMIVSGITLISTFILPPLILTAVNRQMARHNAIRKGNA